MKEHKVYDFMDIYGIRSLECGRKEDGLDTKGGAGWIGRESTNGMSCAHGRLAAHIRHREIPSRPFLNFYLGIPVLT